MSAGRPRKSGERMKFLRPLKSGFAGIARLSGRMARRDFWLFAAMALATLVLIGLLDWFLFGHFGVVLDLGFWTMGPLGQVFAIFGLWALGTAAVRRLHDTGRGVMTALAPLAGGALIFGLGALLFTYPQFRFLPSVSYFYHNLLLGYALAAMALLMLVWLLARPATLGPNRFGPDPREVKG